MRTPHNALIIASGAITALTLITGTAVGADVFSDVGADFWARPYIEWANDNHVMTGPGGQDRSFRADQPTNRAEVAAVSYRLYIRMQQEIDALSQRIVELENRLSRLEGDNDMSTGGSMSVSSPASSAASSVSSTSSPRPPVTGGVNITFPTDRSRRLLLTGSLSGSEMVPAIATNGRGNANLRWTSDGLCYEIGVSGLSSTVLGANFYRGDRGGSGTLLRPIAFTTSDRAQGCWPSLTSEDWQDLLDNNVFLVVNTERYPQGEIRGQVYFRR